MTLKCLILWSFYSRLIACMVLHLHTAIFKLISFTNFNTKFLYLLTICTLHYNPRHVSCINMPIFRRTNCIITASHIVTLCKRLSSMPDESRLHGKKKYRHSLYRKFSLLLFISFSAGNIWTTFYRVFTRHSSKNKIWILRWILNLTRMLYIWMNVICYFDWWQFHALLLSAFAAGPSYLFFALFSKTHVFLISKRVQFN
jgi:hypothetical protein